MVFEKSEKLNLKSLFSENKTDKMANQWASYIPTLKSYYEGGMAAAGIFGHNGSTWAQENGQSFLNTQ